MLGVGNFTSDSATLVIARSFFLSNFTVFIKDLLSLANCCLQIQSTLYKMHCTLFGEDNGKQGQGRQSVCLVYRYVELQSAYRIE